VGDSLTDTLDRYTPDILSVVLKSVLYSALAIAFVSLDQWGLLFLPILFVLLAFTKRAGMELLVISILILMENCFDFIVPAQLPTLIISRGFRLNALDLLIIPAATVCCFKLMSQKNKPASIWFVNGYLLLSTVYLAVGFFNTGGLASGGAIYFRTLLYAGFYYIAMVHFARKENIAMIFFVLGFIVVFATVLQIIEFFQGSRFVLSWIEETKGVYGEEGQRLLSGGEQRLYLWSRVTGMAYLTVPFFLGYYLLAKNRKLPSLTIALMSILTFVLASVRSWMVIISVAMLIVLFNSRINRRVIYSIFGFIGLFFLALFLIQYAAVSTGNTDLLASLTGRIASIFNPQSTAGETDTFTVRLFASGVLFLKFLESPIFGHGIGAVILDTYYNSDLGMLNRMVMFGLLGTLPLLYYLIRYAVKLRKRIKVEVNLFHRIVLITSLAVIVSHLPAYAFQYDFWGNGWIVFILLVMAASDRIMMETETPMVQNAAPAR
jgi:hypothetical protein